MSSIRLAFYDFWIGASFLVVDMDRNCLRGATVNPDWKRAPTLIESGMDCRLNCFGAYMTPRECLR